MQVKKDSCVKTHGPIAKRCPGSCQPPTTIVDSVLSPSSPLNTSSQPPQPSGSSTPVFRNLHSGFKVIKKIPRGSRGKAASKFADAIDDVVSYNSVKAWSRLFHLLSRCFHAPKRTGRCWNLTALINSQISQESDFSHEVPPHNPRKASRIDSLDAISTRISS